MYDIEELNQKFGINGNIKFQLENNEIAIAHIKTDVFTARVGMQGAQVLEWTPLGQNSVIWLSKESNFKIGKSIRGGAPICWPWFGAHGSDSSMPAHGYARTVPWTLIACDMPDQNQVTMSFTLDHGSELKKMWPHNTPLELHVSFGEVLQLELVTKNCEKVPVEITEALHTYFAVSDIRNITVQGLDACDYLDKVQDFKRCPQSGDISFTAETDRVYLDTAGDCIINDAAWQRKIHISKMGSLSTVVWNPWQEKSDQMGDMGIDGYLGMLCVESANAASNFVTIEPGAEHRLLVQYRVE
ncbi:MAG: D-hexose-6-phosphate mutarotase [Gammaproteobacteria bacterium]|nr:D-hexose-6-phosphate mutarotase [Gammaproteobacteria bacterium]